MKKLLTLTLLSLLGPSALAAEESQSIASIRAAVKEFAYAHVAASSPADADIKVRVGRIDQRLRLAACGKPLRTGLKHAASSNKRFTVQVKCQSNTPWTLYVPVTTNVYSEVAVASRRLPRNTLISAADILFVKKPLNRLRSGYIQDAALLVGKKTKRTIQSHAVIRDHALTVPSDVHKGEKVIISAANPLINIRMAGTALADGTIGELIRVKNLSSAKIIEAEIIRPGVVQVRM